MKSVGLEGSKTKECDLGFWDALCGLGWMEGKLLVEILEMEGFRRREDAFGLWGSEVLGSIDGNHTDLQDR